MSKHEKRSCAICEKEIEIECERIGGVPHGAKYITTSKDEGILFLKKWFCNECWKQIIEYARNFRKVI